MKTVRDFQEYFKDKNPDLPVAIWRGENVVMNHIANIDFAEADPKGMNNEDSIPTPAMILLDQDDKDWIGKGVSAYEEDEIS